MYCEHDVASFSNIVINIKVDVFQRIAAANRNFKMWLTYCSENIVKKHRPPQLRGAYTLGNKN